MAKYYITEQNKVPTITNLCLMLETNSCSIMSYKKYTFGQSDDQIHISQVHVVFIHSS